LARLDLTLNRSLNYPVLVATRDAHQTAFCMTSVRQRGRQIASSNPPVLDSEEESRSHFRQRIVRELASYLPPNSAQESLSGVARQVRHTGAPLLPHQVREPGGRTRNKQAIQGIQANVSHRYFL
jgi:hypothetical protein